MSTTDTGTNLGVVITSPLIRKIVYGAWVIAGFVLGGTQVAYLSLHVTDPSWLVASSAVLVYVGIPIGGLAFVNSPTTKGTIMSDPTTGTAPDDPTTETPVEPPVQAGILQTDDNGNLILPTAAPTPDPTPDDPEPGEPVIDTAGDPADEPPDTVEVDGITYKRV